MLNIDVFLHGVFPGKLFSTIFAPVTSHVVVNKLYVLRKIVVSRKCRWTIRTLNSSGNMNAFFVTTQVKVSGVFETTYVTHKTTGHVVFPAHVSFSGELFLQFEY